MLSIRHSICSIVGSLPAFYHLQAVVRYYGIPSLSLRQAMHTTLRQQPQLHTQYWWSANISNDQLHPNCVGHK